MSHTRILKIFKIAKYHLQCFQSANTKFVVLRDEKNLRRGQKTRCESSFLILLSSDIASMLNFHICQSFFLCCNYATELNNDASSGASYVKYGFTMAFTTTILSWGVIRYRRAYEITGQLGHVLDTIKWATDYFIKCHPSEYVYYGQVRVLN